MNLDMSDIERMTNHHRMVNQMHSMIHYAAFNNHAEVNRMFKVLKSNGFMKGYKK